MRKILITSALPYANGHIHLGHLVEYLQTDIWARAQRLRGNRCIYICADDTHGTAIMIRATQEKRTPEEVIADMSEAHQRDFNAMDIRFDHYGSTNSAETRLFCDEIWQSLRQKELIKEKNVSQLYDTQAGTFLADRFVRGTCPKCGRSDQYGDNCECGATYSPTQLINPISTLSGTTPEVRDAVHLFVELEKMHDFLDAWTQKEDHLQPEIANYLAGHFLNDALYDWDISRPAPYFGFEIPDSPGNYWYVWFDAPIGYIGSTLQWCKLHGENIDTWWRSPETEIHHVIGKDITYFHTLFWPAMLKTAGITLPTKVHVHGFLTVNGEKMSKSKGTFILASTYLKHVQNPAYLRYYYASKITGRVDDLDLNFTDMIGKVNADLVGNLVNLASRTTRFVVPITEESKDRIGAAKPELDIRMGVLSKNYPDDDGIFEEAAKKAKEIGIAYEEYDFAKVTRIVMQIGDMANKYVEDKAPWVLNKNKSPEGWQSLLDVCTVALNVYRQMVIYLSPILPQLARDTAELLNENWEEWTLESAKTPLLGTKVNPFKPLMQRMEMKHVEAMIAETQADFEAAEAEKNAPKWNDGPEALANEPLAEECTIDDFTKVDLRVARIIEAKHVPTANKLLQLTLSLGGGETRNVFAGIKSAYDPETLVGRLVICVANLKPRQMKFGLSEGMVCAAGAGGTEIYLLSPDNGAKPGMRVH